jgi:hypothetical protein
LFEVGFHHSFTEIVGLMDFEGIVILHPGHNVRMGGIPFSIVEKFMEFPWKQRL